MHMADALLSPPVGITMLAVSGGILAYSVRKTGKEFAENRIALMGVAGAFVFAAQMINFTIPGTGSSGHIGGAVLLAALLGPAPGFIAMAGVLLIQALFFADGGLLAWGCNLFNLGFFGCFLAYPYILRPLAGKEMRPGRIMAASCAACITAMTLGALSVTLETLCSGITKLPFGAFVAAMVPIHIAIGLGEGLATGAILMFLRRNLPDYQMSVPESQKLSLANLAWVFGLTALLIGGGLSLLASEKPDGLEWAMKRVAGSTELEATGPVYTLAEKVGNAFAILPDYAFKGSESRFGTIVAGIVGVLLCAAVLTVAIFLICRKRKKAATS